MPHPPIFWTRARVGQWIILQHAPLRSGGKITLAPHTIQVGEGSAQSKQYGQSFVAKHTVFFMRNRSDFGVIRLFEERASFYRSLLPLNDIVEGKRSIAELGQCLACIRTDINGAASD